jgi:pimeloyl-ACP methyl ester carboxylesterase
VSPLPLVLVHGGGHGAWCWDPTVEHLQSETLAVDLPPKEVRGGPKRHAQPRELLTLTVSDFAASVLDDDDGAGYDPIVHVGHSMAGLTIPEVARRASERVAHLVFLSCTVPAESENSIDVLMAGAADVGEIATANIDAATANVDTAQQGGDPGPQLSEERVIAMFCNDMDDEQTRFVLDNFGSEALPIVAERVSREGLSADIPKTWIRLLNDAILTPGIQDVCIANLETSPGGTVTVIELDSGHNAMISHPRGLAEILDGIAAAAD